VTHCVKYVAVCRAVVTLDGALARFIGRYPRSRHDGNSLTSLNMPRRLLYTLIAECERRRVSAN